MKKLYIFLMICILCFASYVVGYNTTSTTTNLSLIKILTADDTTDWFDNMNDNLDLIDAGFNSPLSYSITGVAGDVIYYDGSDWVKLGKDVGKYLKSGASTVTWNTPSGVGDMTKAVYDTDGDSDIDVAAGGTEKSSWTLYAIPYLSGTTTFGEITVGTAEYALTVNAGATGYDWTELSYTNLAGNPSDRITAGSNIAWSTDTLNVTLRTEAEIRDWAGAMFSGNTETLIVATYQVADDTVDLVVTIPSDHITAAMIDAVGCGTNCTWDTSNDEIDIDDVFLLYAGDVASGVMDFGGCDSFEIPNKNADPANTGEIILDTTVANMTNGNVAFYDGTAIRYVVSLAAGQIWSADDYVVAYDADNDYFYMKADADSGAPTWDNIGNPAGNDEIDFSTHTIELNVEDFRIGDGGNNYLKIADNGVTTLEGTATFESVDATEFGYLDGVGEDIQTALTATARFADAEEIAGTWEVQDDINFVFGDGADWLIQYDEGVDDQLLFITAQTNAGADTDPLFSILVGATPDSDQQVFGVGKGVQDSNTQLFTVDEDGDVVIAGALDLGTELADAEVSDTLTSSSCTGTAAVGTDVTITANNATNENNLVAFVEDADQDGGDLGLETDTTFYYNPSTGLVTAAGFAGALTGQADTVATITTLAPDTATTQATQASITTCANLTTVGTIGTGVWEGTAIADGYIPDTITISDLQTELDAGAHSIGFTLQTASGDGATLIDWTIGNKMKFTFGAQNETITFTDPSNPCNLLLIIVQDDPGSRTITWDSMTIKWAGGAAPTLTTTADGEDVVSLFFDGTDYYGVASLAFAAP